MMNSLFTPDYSHLTGLLKHLQDNELKELLDDEKKLKVLVSDLKQVHDIEAEREMLLTSNKSISEYNLSKQPVLEAHRKQVFETRQIAISLKDSLMEKKKKIESSQNATSAETLLALLQAATSEKEEEAEAAVEKFLQNEQSVENFLPSYLELRKVAHLRRIKAEKLANLLQSDVITTPPTRPERLRKPPPPPVPTPYPNVGGVVIPGRPAPQPPVRYAYNPRPRVPPPFPGYYPQGSRPVGYAPYPNAAPQPNWYPNYK